MATEEEIRAKADATRLKNLLAKKASKKLSKWDAAMLKTLQAKAAVARKETGTNTFETNPKVLKLEKAKTPKKQKRDAPQIAWDVVQQATGGAKRDWFIEPASPKWTGRKIRNKKSQKEYVIGDVFGEMHVEIERDARTTIHNAANLRESYDAID
jgi:hypothetical protein